MTDKLTDQSFWDGVSATRLDHDAPKRTGRLRNLVRPFLADHNWSMFVKVCRSRLPKGRPLDLLEVGCAPGRDLFRFCDALELCPHGLEYAPAGVEETRRLFLSRSIDESRVHLGDLFSEETTEKLGEQFDVVMSVGLIEHFTDPTVAIQRHIDLLKPGGFLIVQIPNITGLNWLSMWVLRREFIAQHNRNIMRLNRFGALFNLPDVESVFCGRVGFFKFYGRFTRREKSLRGLLAKIADRSQPILNGLQRLVFLGNNVTWPYSPSLLFIGQKRSSHD